MESGEMNTEILGVALQIVLLIVISYPLGKYIAKVYKGEKTWSDFMKVIFDYLIILALQNGRACRGRMTL